MMALVTGGASSGKSAYAERLCARLAQDASSPLVYMAAMKPYGAEGRRRIERHRAARAGAGFTTVECHGDFLAATLESELDEAVVLVEGLENIVANELFDPPGDAACGARAGCARARVQQAMNELAARAHDVVVVGDEIGCDGTEYLPPTRAYQELLGSLACEVGASADFVVEVVAGIPVPVKGTLDD